MTRIVLIRHAHVPGISPETFRGRLDLALTERGREEARLTAKSVAQRWRPSIVYTSPLQRCVATGRVIAELSGVESRAVDDLNDLDYGAWQGKAHAEIQEKSPAQYARWRSSPDLVRFPAGESLQDLALRVANLVRFVIEHHPDDTIVTVGHDASNRALLLQALALPLSAYWRVAQDPAAISEILLHEDRITVLRVNETAHLADLSAL
jgi:probable phosphoglycerate mutase